MRKRMMPIMLGLLLLIPIVLLSFERDAHERSVNAPMEGILITQSGDWIDTSVRVMGTFVEQPDGSGEMDYFRFDEHDGIWINETRLEISTIPFGNADSDYTYFEFSGNLLIMDRNAEFFIAMIASEQSKVVVASPCWNPEELLRMIDELSASDPENKHTSQLSEIRTFIEQ